MTALLSSFRHSLIGTAGERAKQLIRDRAGTAAVAIAVSFTGIAGLAGLGTEAANWYFTQRSIQGAADAAAHTGATALMNSATSAAAKTQACSVVKNFGFTCNTATDVHIPPTSGSHTGSTDAVEVDLSQAQSLMFSGLFLSSAPTITGRSVAVAATSGANAYPPCVMSLDTNSETSLSTSGSPALALNGCSLYVNSAGTGALTMGGGTISASAAYIAGTVSGSGLSATNGTKTGVDPHPDPYASASVPSYTGVTNGSGTGCNQRNFHPNSSQTINASGTTPYVFCNGLKIDAGGVTVTLGAGTYIIDQGSLSITNGGSLIGTAGVTIILTNDVSGGSPATLNINGGTLTLTAPTSGSYKGIALFQDRVTCTGPSSQCMNNLTGGSSQNITGAVYLPNNPVTFTGGASSGGATCTQLIAYQITFQGTSNLNSTCSSAGTQTIYVTASSLAE